VWGDTRIEMPFVKDGTVLRDVLSGLDHTVQDGGLLASAVLATWPAAVLVGGG
jgi:hypothetical protein